MATIFKDFEKIKNLVEKFTTYVSRSGNERKKFRDLWRSKINFHSLDIGGFNNYKVNGQILQI